MPPLKICRPGPGRKYGPGYYCVGIARVQIPLILEVQHIDNTLNELLIKFNSTSPK